MGRTHCTVCLFVCPNVRTSKSHKVTLGNRSVGFQSLERSKAVRTWKYNIYLFLSRTYTVLIPIGATSLLSEEAMFPFPSQRPAVRNRSYIYVCAIYTYTYIHTNFETMSFKNKNIPLVSQITSQVEKSFPNIQTLII